MKVLGALKKSSSDSTIYFCEYEEECFDWNEVVSLLSACNLMQDLDEKDIYCIAVESKDDINTDKKLVGVTFRNGKEYVSLVPQDYTDLDFYLKELSEA